MKNKNVFAREVAEHRRQIRASNRNFPKDKCVRLKLKDEQMTGPDGHKRIALWRSFHFVIQVFENPHGVLRLSINRTEIDRAGRWVDGIDWDSLQWIKNQCGFENCDAVEIFPKAEHFVNDANLRHLFIFPPDVDVPFAWRIKQEPNGTNESASGEASVNVTAGEPTGEANAGGDNADSPSASGPDGQPGKTFTPVLVREVGDATG